MSKASRKILRYPHNILGYNSCKETYGEPIRQRYPGICLLQYFLLVISGGTSAVKERGHFEVKKSSTSSPGVRGVARILHWGTEAERRGGIGIARIFSGVHLFLQKVDELF